jgi:hypothetical protein
MSAVRALMSRARRVPVRRWPAQLATLGLVVVVELGLRTVRLPRLARWLGVPLAKQSSVYATVRAAKEVAARPSLELSDREQRRVADVRRLLGVPGIDGTCLRQGLLVGRALRRHDPRLVLGVAKKDGVVTAHAWLEVEGWVVDDFQVRPVAAGVFEPLATSAQP